MPRTRVKICGIRDDEALFGAAAAGADAVGFIFHKASKRFIDPEEAFELAALLPPFVATVGLFVDATFEQFSKVSEVCPTSLSQLHGSESVDLATRCGPGILKALRFDALTIDAELRKWDKVPEVEAILIDGSAGGEGTCFDWQALVKPAKLLRKPLIVAGGLSPQNVGEAIRLIRPFGVDVSSGVERSGRPGEKDLSLMEAFCAAVREADADASPRQVAEV